MSFFNSTVSCSFIKPLASDADGLLVIQPQLKRFDTLDWIKENTLAIENSLLKFGGILLRNFNVSSLSEFSSIAKTLCPNLLDYIHRSTPRTKLGGKIYTSTEYPKERSIPLHNENSYSSSWPHKIFFYSAIVASEGGETPIADSRSVYKKIDPFIREKFEQKGILYVRNYTAGMDLSWQEVFQTDSKEEVNQYCMQHEIDFEWRDNKPELTTKQVCQATLQHPISGEKAWFNQAHLFHVSSLEENNRLALIKELGETNLPRNTFYGDGEPIEIAILDYIRGVYNQEKIKFKWRKGDILILDNILMAHGREPFEGERKVAVAMG